jgi:hypothetical protein
LGEFTLKTRRLNFFCQEVLLYFSKLLLSLSRLKKHDFFDIFFIKNLSFGNFAGGLFLRGVTLGPQLRYPVVLLAVLGVLRGDAAHQRIR